MNKFRFRSGIQDLRRYGVLSGTVIERSDILWIYTGTDLTTVYPASSFTWTSNLATTQANFAEKFIGIAQESSALGQTDDILVDVSALSIYEMDCPSSNYMPDDKLGCDESSSTLMDQQLEKCVAASAIAVVAYPARSATKVQVQFAPAHTANSSNVNSNIG